MNPRADLPGAKSAPPLREIEHFVRASDGQELALVELRHPSRAAASGDAAFLLLHGLAQNRLSFTLGPMPDALLERGARVFAGELRGHGASRVEGRPRWRLATHLEYDCPALLDGVRERCSVSRVHLVGHSMGGLLGCALLAGDAPLASLTAAAAPLALGAERPLVRLASLLVGPLARIAPRPHRVPMHHLLGALARPLSRPEARGPLRLLQRATRLANPAAAEPAALETILASADAESPAVIEELAANAVLRRTRLAGIDLAEAVRGSSLPIAAVVGTRDIFAPRAAVAPLEAEGQSGPRLIVEVPDGTHMDAVMGHHVPGTIAALWDFLMAGNPKSAPDSRPRRSSGGVASVDDLRKSGRR